MASGANNGVLGLGVHSMWGSSPAADLPAYASSTRSGGAAPAEGEESAAPLRVLVANPSDIRHVLASISRRRRRSVPAVEFYVLERVPEVIARHLLLLQVACDWELPVRQRATVFLEVFGNSQLQDRTQRYVHRLGQELVELVCNQAGALEDFVDLSALKYRERDRLVDVFRSWSPEVPFDVVGMRDYRLRSFYAERYDHRQGACDWDYHQRVKPAAGVVHSKLYKEWRMSGTAFEFGDQVYDRPNRTLGSYAEGTLKKGKDHGIKKEIRGYFVDIVNGPYVSFGVDTDRATEHAEGLFEVQNKGTGTEQHRHHTVEIAMFNLLSYLWEIETGEPYVMKKVGTGRRTRHRRFQSALAMIFATAPRLMCSSVYYPSPQIRPMTFTAGSERMRAMSLTRGASSQRARIRLRQPLQRRSRAGHRRCSERGASSTPSTT